MNLNHPNMSSIKWIDIFLHYNTASRFTLTRWLFGVLLGVGIWGVLSPPIWADYQKALTHYYQGRYQEAELELTDLEHPNARLLLSLVQLRQQHYQAARRSFSKVTVPPIGGFERVVRFWFTPTENVSELERVAKQIDSTETRAFQDAIYFELADAWMDVGRLDKSKMLLQKLLKNAVTPDIRDRSRLQLVRIAVQEGDQATAEALYAEALLMNPVGDKGFGLLLLLNQTFGTRYGVLDALKTQSNQLTFVKKMLAVRAYGDFRKMATDYLKRYPHSTDRDELETGVGVALFEEGNYVAADLHFKQAIPRLKNESQRVRASYYHARSIHRQKRYEDAKLAYQSFVSAYQTVTYTPAAYYYLYWVYSELGDLSSYQPFLKAFKSRYGDTLYYDKIMWEYGWNAYLKRDYAGARDIFGKTDWKFGTDIQMKVRFWLARITAQLDPQSSRSHYLSLLQDHPFSYYGFRVIKTLFPNQVNELVARFQPTGLVPDPIYATLLQIGLGDLAATDLDYKVKRLKDRNPKTVYNLAYVYSKMFQNHKAIGLLSSLGFSVNPKDAKVSKEIAQLLYPRPYWPVIQRYSTQYGVDPYLVLAVMREESLFNTNARSRVGALGLMQIMPATGRGIAGHFKQEWRGEETLLEPETNIKFGIHYVASLSRRFNGNPVLILSGYNAGPNATRRWMNRLEEQEMDANDIDSFVATIPYSETHHYVMKVLKSYWIYRLLYENGVSKTDMPAAVSMTGSSE